MHRSEKRPTLKKLTIAATLAATVLTAGVANAASTASDATASIVAAIAITNSTGLNFGQIVPSVAIGTVTVPPVGAKSFTGGVTLANAVTATPAAFEVTGAGSNAFTITLPTSINVTGPGVAMVVDNFVSSPVATAPATLDVDGTLPLLVGATLNVGVSQAAGTYTGTFNVAVVYN
jgi:hypothetical protein